MDKAKRDDVLRSLGIFRTSEAIANGISQPTLSRLAKTGEVIRLEHGIYYQSSLEVDHSTLDLAIACKRLGPQSFIGGLTSLYRHRLISHVPDRIWLVVPPTSKVEGAYANMYRCIRTKTDLFAGVVEHKYYRMAGIERSLIEAFQFSTKIGIRTALSATRHALNEHLTTEKQLYNLAMQLDILETFSKHWEAIVAE